MALLIVHRPLSSHLLIYLLTHLFIHSFTHVYHTQISMANSRILTLEAVGKIGLGWDYFGFFYALFRMLNLIQQATKDFEVGKLLVRF